MKVKQNRKGQLSLVGLVITFVLLIVFAAFYPAMAEVIDNFVANSTNVTLNILVQLFPLLMFLGIIITFFTFVATIRPQ